MTIPNMGTVAIPMDVANTIPYFEAMLRWESKDGTYTLPLMEELGGSVAPLEELVRYAGCRLTYSPPLHHMMLTRCLCLANFLGMDDFISLVATYLGCPQERINRQVLSITKLIRTVRNFSRSHHHHVNRISHGECVVCHKLLMANPSQPFIQAPCCNIKVHAVCWRDICPQICCWEKYQLLSCALCRDKISYNGSSAKWYDVMISHRLLCCGADLHPMCHEALFSSPNITCPLCKCHLNVNGTLSDACTIQDVSRSRREKFVNNYRRRGKIVDKYRRSGK